MGADGRCFEYGRHIIGHACDASDCLIAQVLPASAMMAREGNRWGRKERAVSLRPTAPWIQILFARFRRCFDGRRLGSHIRQNVGFRQPKKCLVSEDQVGGDSILQKSFSLGQRKLVAYTGFDVLPWLGFQTDALGNQVIASDAG